MLNVSTLANAGQNSSIGTNGTIIITNGGVLQYGGSTVSIDRNINLASGIGVIGVTNAATDLTISGVISNSGSLVKTNGGTLILSGANTYSGTTTVGAGVLNIQNNAGLGATNSGTTVGSGAALELQGGITIGAEALTLNGTGINSGGALRNVAGTNTYGGAITLGSASTISADADSTLQLTNTIGGNFGKTFGGDGAISASRVISGSGGLTKIGTGTLTLGATNTFTGGISLFGGTLSVASSNNLGANTVTITNKATFSITDNSTTLTNSFVLTNGGATVFVAGGNTFWSGRITGGGGLDKQGGDLILNGTGKTNNIGAIGVQGGRLFVFDSLSNIAGSAITVSNAATLAFQINANTNIVTNSITIVSGGGLANRSGTLVVSNAANFATAGSILFNNDDQPTTNIVISNNYPALTGNLTVQVGGGNTNVGAVTFSGVVSGANTNTISKTGSGTLIFAGANTYSGGTVVAEGTLTLSGSGRLGATNGNVSIGAGTVNLGGLSRTNGAFTLDSGNLTNGTLTATSYALTNAGTVSSVLAGSGALTKSGAGTATLSGANTFSGVLSVQDGSLSIATINNASANGVLGNSANAVVLGAAGTTGELLYTGATAGSTKTFSLASGGTGAINVSNSTTALTLTGSITGAGNLAKNGAGTLVLSASNNYSGTTTVSAGVLSLANTNALSGSTLDYSSAGRISFSNLTGANLGGLQGSTNLALTNASGGVVALNVGGNNSSTTYSGALSGGGGLTKSGAGTLTLSGANTYSGGTLISAGALQFGNGGTTGSLWGAITNFASLIFNRSDSITQSNAISGSGSLTKNGIGTLFLTASNSFTGATTVSAGTLNLNSASGSALGSVSSLSVATNATLLVSQSGQVSDSAAVTLSGGTIRTAAGVSEVFGNLSVTGSGFLDFGTTSYANANTINFGTYTPSALLTINNFDYGSTLTFGSDLTSTINNSSFFTFTNGGIASSSWNGTTFTITAIPEPSTYLAAAALLGLMLWPSRKRLLKDAQKILGLRAPTRDRLAAQRIR